MFFSTHPFDTSIFVGFLLINLTVGLSYGRSVKTIRDYALGGKNFSTSTLVATIVATWYGGGSLFRTLERTYSDGLYYVIAIVGAVIGLLLSAQLATRLREFMNNVSVAEALGSIYGRTIQIITAISGITGQIGFIAIQFKVISTILITLFRFDNTGASIIAAGIVILYSSLGGIKAVTFTDVIQFFTFGTIIPVLALVIWNNLNDSTQVVSMLRSNPMFDLREVVGWTPAFMNTVGLFLYFAIPVYTPEIFQRMAMARNVLQAKRALTYAAGISFMISLLLAWVGILLLADTPGLASSQVVSHLINRYTYPGFKGLLAVCITALAMSTADSSLNASSVLFANDIVRPLTSQTRRSVVMNARIFSVFIGLIALLLALYSKDILSLLLFSGSLYLPIITVPLLMAVLGFRSKKRAVLIGMAAGFMTVVLWSILYDNSDSIIPGMLANLLTLLGSHYLLGESGGWQPVAPDSPLGLERAARKEVRQRRLQAIKNFKLYSYLRKNLPQQEGIYSLFGFYAIIATYSALYAIEPEDVQTYKNIYECIVHTGLFATTAFLTFPIWPPTVKSYRFMTFFWPLGMAAILFFAGTLIVIMSHFEAAHVLVLMLNLLLAVLLLQWPLAILLAVSGVSLALLFFHYYTGDSLPWNLLIASQFRLLYGLLLFVSLLVALFKGKQAYAQLGRKNHALTRLDQENKASLLQAFTEKSDTLQALRGAGVGDLLNLARELQTMHVAEEDKERMQALRIKLIPVAFQLQGIGIRATDYLRLNIEKNYAIEQLLSTVRARLQDQGLEARLHYRSATQHQALTCDPERLATLLTKSIMALQAQSKPQDEEKQVISLVLEDTQLQYALPDVAQGYTREEQALRIGITTEDSLPPLAPIYLPDLAHTEAPSPQTSQALDHLANSRIIKAHYGCAEVSDHTLLYVLPVNVKTVRPKDMDKSYMELGTAPIRANDQFKNEEKGIDAQAQEKEFLAAVTARSQADLGMIKTALELIKWYHGPVNRHSGEPFYLHPLAVAQIVLDYNQDEATILGALLHDTVEDTAMLLQHIGTVFGPETADIVDIVTHLQSIPGSFSKIKLTEKENLQMLESVGNTRALYVKLADRMHNMRTIGGHSSVAKRKLVAQETLEFFVPLAGRLGLQEAVKEFKERCQEVLATKE